MPGRCALHRLLPKTSRKSFLPQAKEFRRGEHDDLCVHFVKAGNQSAVDMLNEQLLRFNADGPVVIGDEVVDRCTCERYVCAELDGRPLPLPEGSG